VAALVGRGGLNGVPVGVVGHPRGSTGALVVAQAQTVRPDEIGAYARLVEPADVPVSGGRSLSRLAPV